jgi:hypothetical protein
LDDSGINKADMRMIGWDILFIKGFNPEKTTMEISVPPNIFSQKGFG